ncbi:3-beta-hydroxysteroid-Delta(8)-Delta(7)-isomerase [Apiospora arundinis]
MNSNVVPPAGGDALPEHPFYPLGIALPGYIANEMSTIQILCIFAATCGSVMLPTLLAINRKRPDLPKRELSTAMWFVLCGCIHLILEGYFAFNAVATSRHVLAQMWKEYSLSDSRYLTRDAFVVTMETVTAVCWGPLSFVCAWCIVADHPARHVLQAVISLGQIYGDVLYYGTCTLEYVVRALEFSRPEPYYFYGYYVFLNAIWIVIPSMLLWSSCKKTARAFARVQQLEATKNGKAH